MTVIITNHGNGTFHAFIEGTLISSVGRNKKEALANLLLITPGVVIRDLTDIKYNDREPAKLHTENTNATF